MVALPSIIDAGSICPLTILSPNPGLMCPEICDPSIDPSFCLSFPVGGDVLLWVSDA